MIKKGNEVVMSEDEYQKLVKNINFLADIVINGHDNNAGEVDFEGDANKARNIKRSIKLYDEPIEEETSIESLA